MVPIIGKAHVAYLPNGRRAGPVQDRPRRRDLRSSPADAGDDDGADRQVDRRALNPRGVAVMIEAEHMCMSMRGIQKQGSTTLTTTFTGAFKTEPTEQVRFMTMIRS
jgi:GTP cyclohydrolase I